MCQSCLSSILDNLCNACVFGVLKQAKPETVEKVSDIVKQQLALTEGTSVTSKTKFSELGADSLDTVCLSSYHLSNTKLLCTKSVLLFFTLCSAQRIGVLG